MKKIKSYGFWVALSGAVVFLVNALGRIFGFSVEDEAVSNVIMAIAGVLVVFGVVVMPEDNEENNEENSKEKGEYCEKQEDEDSKQKGDKENKDI